MKDAVRSLSTNHKSVHAYCVCIVQHSTSRYHIFNCKHFPTFHHNSLENGSSYHFDERRQSQMNAEVEIWSRCFIFLHVVGCGITENIIQCDGHHVCVNDTILTDETKNKIGCQQTSFHRSHKCLNSCFTNRERTLSTITSESRQTTRDGDKIINCDRISKI